MTMMNYMILIFLAARREDFIDANSTHLQTLTQVREVLIVRMRMSTYEVINNLCLCL